MKTQLIREGGHRMVITETVDAFGVLIYQGRDNVELTWDEAIRVRDWLQLAISERVERLRAASGE